MSDEMNDLDPWLDGDGADEPTVALFGELTPVPYLCAACGEPNETQFDLSAGYNQEYTEDCTVCCRPNLLTISVDYETNVVTIVNELEYS